MTDWILVTGYATITVVGLLIYFTSEDPAEDRWIERHGLDDNDQDPPPGGLQP